MKINSNYFTVVKANTLIIICLEMFLLGDVESGKKIHTIPGGRKGTEDRHVGHTAHILCMAISSDGKYLVSSSSSAIPAFTNFGNPAYSTFLTKV